MGKWSIITCLFCLFCTLTKVTYGQEVASLYKQAESYEKAFRDDDALETYLNILKREPRNVDVLTKVSQLYNVIGKRFSEKEKQKAYYQKGLDYARNALRINANHSEANFAMAISMGRMALVSSGEEKIRAVKEIKQYADKCIQLDANNYKGYHVLAKWHYEVSDLSGLERWLVKVTYGALPPASLDDAIKYYEKSKQLSPSFLLNYLELAKAYKRKNDKKRARILLEQMQKLPLSSSDDAKIKSLGRKLLDDL